MNSDFNRPQVLECPSCGATLALPSDADTFECDYCGKRIMLPPELRRSKPGAQTTNELAGASEAMDMGGRYPPQAWGTTTGTSQRQASLWLIVGISLAILLVGVLVFILLANSPASSSSGNNIPSLIEIPNLAQPTAVPFARLALVFGSEGDQPGAFADARYIAVDPQQNIFVADYTSGRINKFDPQGNFLSLIKIEPRTGNYDVYIHGMAADQAGNLYLSADGNILKYDTGTGALLATIPEQFPEVYYSTLVVAPDGNLYSTNFVAGGEDEIFVLTPDGQLVNNWQDMISPLNHDDPALDIALAVNQAGKLYLLSPFANTAYIYNPDGTFNSKFGEQGDNPGQLDLSTGLIEVTSRGDLLISDVYRVDLFDANGVYLGKTFTVDYQVAGGSIFGMTLDATDNPYFITSGGKVLKYELSYP